MGERALGYVRLGWEYDLFGKLGDLVLANLHRAKDHSINNFKRSWVAMTKWPKKGT